MKKYLSIFTLILISCSALAAGKTGLPDREISRLLIGKWRIILSEDNMKLDAVDEYRPDGRVIQEGRLTASGRRMNIRMESTWKVEKGKLISRLLSIKPEGLLPVGTTTADTVISINKNTFVFRDDKAKKRRTYYRIVEKVW